MSGSGQEHGLVQPLFESFTYNELFNSDFMFHGSCWQNVSTYRYIIKAESDLEFSYVFKKGSSMYAKFSEKVIFLKA